MRKLSKLLAYLGVILIPLAVAAWLAWFPSPIEPDYRQVSAWGGGQLVQPEGIAVSGEEVFVSDTGHHRVAVFDRQGAFLRAIGGPDSGPGALAAPAGLAVALGKLYVSDRELHVIKVYTQAGEHIRTLGGQGSEQGAFNRPSAVAVLADGRLQVADSGNQRVQVLRIDGQFVSQVGVTGVPGVAAGLFKQPVGVAVNGDGWLFVVDRDNQRVQVFNPEGEASHRWGGPLARGMRGRFPGWFDRPTAIALGVGDRLFVADANNHRIQKFAVGGSLLAVIPLNTGTVPSAVAVDEKDLYVLDGARGRVLRFRQR